MKYNTFLWVFILSILSAVVFLIFYLQAIFSFVQYSTHHSEPDVFEVFDRLFTPAVIISFVVMIVLSLAYRIMAIICIAKNKVITGGEKALWIVGFIIFGFVTGIVFLVLAKSRKLVAQDLQADSAV